MSDRRVSIDLSLDSILVGALSMTKYKKVEKMFLGFLSRKQLISTKNHGVFERVDNTNKK